MNKLFLNNLEIFNYRAFQHLKIGQFGRVNLIVGKNSVGKTSLLECLKIYSSENVLKSIQEVLVNRNEYSRRFRLVGTNNSSDKFLEDDIEAFLSALTNLFYGHQEYFDYSKIVNISSESPQSTLTLATGWFVVENDESGAKQLKPIEEEELETVGNPIPGLKVTRNGRSRVYRLDRRNSIINIRSDQQSALYVSTNGLTDSMIARLWKPIALTELEDVVTKALQLIVNDIERVTLIDKEVRLNTRYPIVKIKGIKNPVPIQSLGDGMTRVFGIVLALVNCQNGMLLIDEFENGLHYTIQFELWKLIFKVAEELGIQVFATTHSNDCINAFQEAAKESDEDGLLIRLEKRNEQTIPVLIDEEKLEIVARRNIEVR